VVVGHSGGNTLSLLLGDGHGSFGAPTNITVGNNPQFVTVSDLNGDFHDDLAVANGGDADIMLLYGNGDGTFQTPVTLSVGTNTVFIAVGNFNAPVIPPATPPGPGPDLAIANRGDNSVTVYKSLDDGMGGTHFVQTAVVTVGNQPDSIALGDFNGDQNQ